LTVACLAQITNIETVSQHTDFGTTS